MACEVSGTRSSLRGWNQNDSSSLFHQLVWPQDPIRVGDAPEALWIPVVTLRNMIEPLTLMHQVPELRLRTRDEARLLVLDLASRGVGQCQVAHFFVAAAFKKHRSPL